MGNPNDWQYLLPLILLKLAAAALRYYWPVTLAVVLLLALLLSGCVSTQCISNPRNMSCMSADEIQRELSQ